VRLAVDERKRAVAIASPETPNESRQPFTHEDDLAPN
jgi:hypothetical protein